MDDERLANLLGIAIIPGIIEHLGLADFEQPAFLDSLYRSQLFALLEQQETGLWHLSPATLAEAYRAELDGGAPQLPEEQS